MSICDFCFYGKVGHLYLHLLTPSFPTRRSADLPAGRGQLLGRRLPDAAGGACDHADPALAHAISSTKLDAQRPSRHRLQRRIDLGLAQPRGAQDLAAVLAEPRLVVPHRQRPSVEAKGGVGDLQRALARSEERRVGKECVSTFRSRWSPYT